MSYIETLPIERARNSRLLAVSAIFVCLFLYFLSYVHHEPQLFRPAPEINGLVSVPRSTSAKIRAPDRLIIPAIHVDAQIETVSVQKDGSIGVPHGPDDVAWLDASPVPGEPGSAIIDGHRGWMDQIHAVFDDLHLLRPGDLIYVKDQEGRTAPFAVQSIRTFTASEDVSSIFASSTAARLNLITCDGDWDAVHQTYSRRIVVFAEKVTLF